MQAAYGRLPLSFEPLPDQTENSSQFFSWGGTHSLLLKANQAVFELPIASARSSVSGRSGRKPANFERQSLTLRMTLLGGHSHAKSQGQDELPTKIHYFTSNDPKKWRTGVPSYSKVRYQNVYPRIDVIYYGNQQQLEYDFVISPGGNPRDIRLSFDRLTFDGTEDTRKTPLEIDSHGDLVLHTQAGVIVQKKAVAYQEIDGVRKEIPSKYVLKGGSEVGFDLESYEPSKPLLIDPILYYSATGVGGSSIAWTLRETLCCQIASHSKRHPGLSAHSGGGSCVNGWHSSCPDILIAKLNSANSLDLRYLSGGSGSEYGYGIAVDSARCYVTGTTTSTIFRRPTLCRKFQRR
jgi:hypothetical protein